MALNGTLFTPRIFKIRDKKIIFKVVQKLKKVETWQSLRKKQSGIDSVAVATR